MPTPTGQDSIPIRFTHAQRLAVSQLLPEFADRLLLDCKNQRTLSFSREELIQMDRLWDRREQLPANVRPHVVRNVAYLARKALEQFEIDERVRTSAVVFQFKVTLLETNPPIWRRIAAPDGTLDSLHEHIQCAMGWTNSHLHQFVIGRRTYGDPQLLDDGFEDTEFEDSTDIWLSDLLAKVRRPFRFEYQYDFGDDWRHEVVLEEMGAKEPGVVYPHCVAGARACPPEDVGGTWGYEHFLEVLQDPRHEEHDDMVTWAGTKFDPERFDAKKTTKLMQKGLPDWRDMM
jgi:hypothetical protein